MPQQGVVVVADHVRIPAIDSYDIRIVRGGVIEGTLRDADSGAPIAGATVVADEWDGTPGPWLGAGVTDAEGRYRLSTWRRASRLTSFHVDDTRYASHPVEVVGVEGLNWGVVDGQHFVLDLRARRAASVKGRLLGPDGPLGSFRVVAEQPRRLLVHTVTAADGTFRLSGLASGYAMLSVCVTASDADYVPGMNVDNPDVRTELGGIDLDPGELEVGDVLLPLTRASIRGRVVDEDGDPIAGAEVVGNQGSLTARFRTGADGRFAADVAFVGTGTWFEVHRRGFLVQGFAISYAIHGVDPLVLRRPPTVTVVVREADGRPLPHAEVTKRARDDWDDAVDVFTDPSGKVTSHASSVIAARYPSDGASPAPVREGVAQFRAPTRVAGKVVASDGGEPLGDVVIRSLSATSGVIDWPMPVLARTDAAGRFAFDLRVDPEDPHAYDGVVFESVGRIGIVTRMDALGAAMVVELRPAYDVRVRLRHPDGKPVDHVLVQVDSPDEEGDGVLLQQRGTSDASGLAIFPGVPPGTIEVLAYHALHGGADVTTTTGAGEIVLVLAERAELEVMVIDVHGNAVAGASVDATWAPEGEDDRSVENTDVAGRAVMNVLKSTALSILCTKDGYEPVERKDVRVGAEPLKVVLVEEK